MAIYLRKQKNVWLQSRLICRYKTSYHLTNTTHQVQTYNIYVDLIFLNLYNRNLNPSFQLNNHSSLLLLLLVLLFRFFFNKSINLDFYKSKINIYTSMHSFQAHYWNGFLILFEIWFIIIVLFIFSFHFYCIIVI